MGTQQRNLSIVFRELQPERLYQHICSDRIGNGMQKAISAATIQSDVFQSLAHTQYPAYSFEEIDHVYQLMTTDMKPPSTKVATAPSVFFLLVRMGARVFKLVEDKPVCKFSEMLAWQNVYQKLGQDIFTTAFLAYEDLRRGESPRSEFIWDAVIKTDNARLKELLQRGIAENHCHLGGTTQSFPLSWACVMNYPQTIRLAAAQIKQNLQPHLNRGAEWNVWSWEKRLEWAAYLRIELFKLLENDTETGHPLDMEMNCFHPMLHIKRELRYLKSNYAARVPQYGKPDFILDYALRGIDCKNGLLDHHERLISGERSFLYRCFRACFDGTFCEDTQNWFYMYLLLKENFRAELIQVNRQAGFRNFKDYQDRKDSIFYAIPGYRAESVRLSVNANQQSQSIVSFEARIAPRPYVVDLYRQIRSYEKMIKDAGGIPEGREHFYVYHFIKAPDNGKFPDRPRNRDLRQENRRSAKALRYALQHSARFCDKIWGIDAANIEIGCRPEVFATEIRYLKDTKPLQRRKGFLDLSTQPHIQITYHVGEDFLDITDGLRAIDEAVKFLGMERGSRIGHALALGVDPAIHYRFKNHRVILPKQDFLDNTIWILFRAQELGITINSGLQSLLKTKADRYLSELYGNLVPVSVGQYEYYCAMQLRGDAPELYQVLPYQSPEPFLFDSYDSYKEDPREELKEYRKQDLVTILYQCYHYSKSAREKGREVIEFTANEEYIDLIRKVQDGLIRELTEKGLMIECNPTSNYLIGTFRRYDAHPIFRFNNNGLVRTDGKYEASAQISVSINTDDLGVFDTSLENEYAILAASLERTMIGTERKYSKDSIYVYLDSVRKMGLEQSFLLSGAEDRFRKEPDGFRAISDPANQRFAGEAERCSKMSIFIGY